MKYKVWDAQHKSDRISHSVEEDHHVMRVNNIGPRISILSMKCYFVIRFYFANYLITVSKGTIAWIY